MFISSPKANFYTHLYKLLEILSEENNKLKNAYRLTTYQDARRVRLVDGLE